MTSTMDALREKSEQLHPEVLFMDRANLLESLTSKPRTTLPYLSKYEFTEVLAARKNQLANGALPTISIEGMDTNDPRFIHNIAEREILERKLPFLWLCRRMPDKKNEYWCLTELELSWV